MQAQATRISTFKASLVAFGLTLGFAQAAQAAPLGLPFFNRAATAEPLPVAADFEIDKFVGGWFEIASKSSLFSGFRSDAVANFALVDGYPNTLQATFKYNTPVSEQAISGILAPADERYPATLLFTYSAPPVTNTDFYVLAVAPDYSWALVGDRARSNAYVYAREASIDPQLLRSLIIRLSTDFDYVTPERSMNCTYHAGKTVPGCGEILDD